MTLSQVVEVVRVIGAGGTQVELPGFRGFRGASYAPVGEIIEQRRMADRAVMDDVVIIPAAKGVFVLVDGGRDRGDCAAARVVGVIGFDRVQPANSWV